MVRWQYINLQLSKFAKSSYLEIGVREGNCAKNVKASRKWGVDPRPSPLAKARFNKLFVKTSDAFFASLDPSEKFDVVFVDGLHYSAQVYRDVVNSLRHLNPEGCIVMHDCNPKTELAQNVPMKVGQGPWNGDCWKAMVKLRAEHPELTCHTLDTDQGLGIVVPKPCGKAPLEGLDSSKLGWRDLVARRQELLGLTPVGK